MHPDLFGLFLKDQAQTEQDIYYYSERDDGLIHHRSASQYFSGPGHWKTEELQILDLAGHKILDIGCGAGRTALYLQKEGKKVLGIDPSEGALEVCRNRGIKCIKQYMMDLQFEETFDTLILLGANIGLAASPEGLERFFEQVKNITRADSTIIFDHRDPTTTDDPIHTAYHQKNREEGRPAGQVRFRLRYKTYKSDWIDFYLPTMQELQEILDKTGWKIDTQIDRYYCLKRI